MTDIDRLCSLYAPEPQPISRSQPGDRVTVDSLSGTFTVESFDGSLFRLRSEHGAIAHVGVRVVVRPASFATSNDAREARRTT